MVSIIGFTLIWLCPSETFLYDPILYYAWWFWMRLKDLNHLCTLFFVGTSCRTNESSPYSGWWDFVKSILTHQATNLVVLTMHPPKLSAPENFFATHHLIQKDLLRWPVLQIRDHPPSREFKDAKMGYSRNGSRNEKALTCQICPKNLSMPQGEM